jgi:hypothetical protein
LLPNTEAEKLKEGAQFNFFYHPWMNIEIDKAVVSKTTKCSYSFGCLNNDKKLHCKIDKSIGNVIFVGNEKRGLRCSYMIPFGSSFICVCPVRNEIFRQFKI